MNSHDFFLRGHNAGCPRDQLLNFANAAAWLQPKQLAASAAARDCDQPDGPTAVGYGGARGGGKSHWLLAQMGADDCQRVPGLKCLLLRKVGKSNLENFEDLRGRVLREVPHRYLSSKQTLIFDNGSRIIAGHFQHESDIDAYLGLEYDVIGIEEATTLTHRKYRDISTCLRTSKPNWRPRIYCTANPGGVGHGWFKKVFVDAYHACSRRELAQPIRNAPEARQRHTPSGMGCGNESLTSPLAAASETRNAKTADEGRPLPSPSGRGIEGEGQTSAPSSNCGQGEGQTGSPSLVLPSPRLHAFAGNSSVFIPATIHDNSFINPEYSKILERLTGWQKRAWLHGDWDIAAGQFFTNFRRDVHVIKEFERTPDQETEWFAAMDYGFTHYTVVLLGALDEKGNMYVVDEHCARQWLPKQHAVAIEQMIYRNGTRPHELINFVAGADCFHATHGSSIADQYSELKISLSQANCDRVGGWAEILRRLGDPDRGIKPTLFIHERCKRVIECLPRLQHDPLRPEDVLKVDADDEGAGGDDAADALRYLVAHRIYRTQVVRLGW